MTRAASSPIFSVNKILIHLHSLREMWRRELEIKGSPFINKSCSANDWGHVFCAVIFDSPHERREQPCWPYSGIRVFVSHPSHTVLNASRVLRSQHNDTRCHLSLQTFRLSSVCVASQCGKPRPSNYFSLNRHILHRSSFAHWLDGAKMRESSVLHGRLVMWLLALLLLVNVLQQQLRWRNWSLAFVRSCEWVEKWTRKYMTMWGNWGVREDRTGSGDWC